MSDFAEVMMVMRQMLGIDGWVAAAFLAGMFAAVIFRREQITSFYQFRLATILFALALVLPVIVWPILQMWDGSGMVGGVPRIDVWNRRPEDVRPHRGHGHWPGAVRTGRRLRFRLDAPARKPVPYPANSPAAAPPVGLSSYRTLSPPAGVNIAFRFSLSMCRLSARTAASPKPARNTSPRSPRSF